MINKSTVWVTLLSCLMIVGCGGAKKSNRPPVFPIQGIITYKGQPVTNADVTFVCEEKERSAFGRTDDKGHFKLTTFASNDGAVAGKHIVKVAKIDGASGTKSEIPDVTDPSYDPFKVVQMAQQPQRPKNAIPQKYTDQKTSDLFVMVLDDGNNPEIKLELKD